MQSEKRKTLSSKIAARITEKIDNKKLNLAISTEDTSKLNTVELAEYNETWRAVRQEIAQAKYDEGISSAIFATNYSHKKRLGQFADPLPDKDNPKAVFKTGYLRHGLAMLFVAPLGVGKSSFVSQSSECWARGIPSFGFEPTRPLKVGVFETEDDEDEVADFRNNFRNGFIRDGWTELEVGEVENGENAPEYYPLDGITPKNFLDYLDYCTKRDKTDLVIINPLYDFLGGDLSKQSEVKPWMQKLMDIAKNNGFALLIVHHTNKVPSNAKDRKDWCNGTSAAYAGSGSMVIPSSCRAVVFMRRLEKDGNIFELCAAKRGRRLGWKDANGKKTVVKYLAHSDDLIYWRYATQNEIATNISTVSKGENKIPAGVQRVVNIITEHGRPFDSVKELHDALNAKYDMSDESYRKWINKGVDMELVERREVKNSQKILVGLPSQFADDEEDD